MSAVKLYENLAAENGRRDSKGFEKDMPDKCWSYVCSSLTDGQEAFVEEFLREAVIKEYPARVHLIRQGEETNYLYLILDGCAETYILTEDGRKKTNMVFARMSMLGISCLDQKTSMVGVRCLSRVKAAMVHKSSVKAWPNGMLLSLAMIQTLKMQGVYRQLREQTFFSVEEQIVKFLADWEKSGISESENGPKEISRQLMADVLGLSRVRVVTVLGQMRQKGALSSEEMLLLKMEREGGSDGLQGI